MSLMALGIGAGFHPDHGRAGGAIAVGEGDEGEGAAGAVDLGRDVAVRDRVGDGEGERLLAIAHGSHGDFQRLAHRDLVLSVDKCRRPGPYGYALGREGGKLSLRGGRFGAFVACNNYPECKYTRRFAQPGGAGETSAEDGVMGQHPDWPRIILRYTLRDGSRVLLLLPNCAR